MVLSFVLSVCFSRFRSTKQLWLTENKGKELAFVTKNKGKIRRQVTEIQGRTVRERSMCSFF